MVGCMVGKGEGLELPWLSKESTRSMSLISESLRGGAVGISSMNSTYVALSTSVWRAKRLWRVTAGERRWVSRGGRAFEGIERGRKAAMVRRVVLWGLEDSWKQIEVPAVPVVPAGEVKWMVVVSPTGSLAGSLARSWMVVVSPTHVSSSGSSAWSSPVFTLITNGKSVQMGFPLGENEVLIDRLKACSKRSREGAAGEGVAVEMREGRAVRSRDWTVARSVCTRVVIVLVVGDGEVIVKWKES